MRAIVLSDSHGSTASLERAIASVGEKNIDMIIHLGDIARDVDYLESMYYPIKVASVVGNNDFMHGGDHEKVITFDNHRIFICHGHTLGVRYGTEKLEEMARIKECEAALFGHTHQPTLQKCDDGLLVLNPGSVSLPRGSRPSFAVLETENGELKATIVDWML